MQWRACVMWKILIVEDEVHVRKSLISSFDWQASGFEVVGEAGNGLRAWEFIEAEQPDLVICDIFMPVMDGIELLKKTKEAGLPCLFVMLTCLNEFEYVRLALQHGAFDYILKLSMDIATMKEILAKVDAELIHAAKQTSRILFVDFQQMYHGMWEALIQRKEYRLTGQELEQSVGRWSYVLICSVLNGDIPVTVEDFTALGFVVPDRHAAIHQFSVFGQTTFFYWYRNKIELKPFFDDVPLYPTVVCSCVPGKQLYEAWRDTLAQLDQFWYSGLKQLHFFEIGKSLPGGGHYVPWKQERKLIHYFEQARLEECVFLLEEIWNGMERSLLPMYMVKDTALQLDSLLLRIANSPFVDTNELILCTNHKELLSKLVERLRTSVRHAHGTKEPLTNHNEINKILDYIHENYNSNITLKSMAQFVALDEHYLSNLFKKKTGGNFIDYLHGVRVKKAKNFLDHTDLTVNEVGERVGFVSDNYFIKIFKRWTGMTPTHYRNRNAE